MSNTNIQNQSGRLNLYVKDTGTSNVYPHIRTLRFDPEGSVTRGPSGQEVTIDTNFAGGGAAQYSDVLWKVGSAGTDNICAKYAPGCDAIGNYAVAHGQSSVASGLDSYAGGNTCIAEDVATHVTGKDNRVIAPSLHSTIVAGSSNEISETNNAAIIGGEGNKLLSGSDNSIILGGHYVGVPPNSTQANVTYVGKHLEVGKANPLPVTVQSIKRVSAIAANSWEDGECGSSSDMWFLPGDFRLSNTRTGIIGETTGICTTRPSTIISSGGANPCIVYSDPGAGLTAGQYVAMKMIPKGFQVIDAVLFNFVAVPSWCGPVGPESLGVYETNLSTGAITQIGTVPLAPAAANEVVPLTLPAEGTGDTAVIVVINKISPYILGEGIISVQVTLQRI